jgi:sirohydrochlorin cobaltochelatase
MSTTRSGSPPAPATDPAGPAARPRWAEAALLLVAHGSERSPEPGSATASHAEVLRRLGLFREVRACFLKAAPTLRETVDSVDAPAAYLVPCFMSDGLSTRTVIPRELGLTGPVTLREGATGALSLFYCEPVGVHPGLAELIARRVEDACRARGLPPGTVSVLLVGHGTPREPASGEAVRRHAGRLEERGPFARVRAVFLEEPPYLEDEAKRLGPGPAVVVGLFAEAGAHGEEDVPRLLGLAAKGGPPGTDRGPVHYLGPIGPDPEIPEFILDQVRAFDARYLDLGGGA